MVMDIRNKVVNRRTECRFDNTDLCRSCIKTGECAPVIDNKSSTNYIGSSINSTGLKSEKGIDIKHVLAVTGKRKGKDGPLREPAVDWTARPDPG
jgi:hypothetical protein